MQNDQGPMLRRQSAECPVEGISVGEHREGVARFGMVYFVGGNFDDAPACPPVLVDRGVDSQSVQPCLEPVGIPQAWEIPPGTNQGILDRVARTVAVTGDQAGGRVQSRCSSSSQHGKGIAIASLCSFHERPLVHVSVPMGGGALVTPLTMVWRLWKPNRFAKRVAPGGGITHACQRDVAHW